MSGVEQAIEIVGIVTRAEPVVVDKWHKYEVRFRYADGGIDTVPDIHYQTLKEDPGFGAELEELRIRKEEPTVKPVFSYGDLVETTDGAYAGVVCPNPDGSDNGVERVYVAWKAAPTRTGSVTLHSDLLRLSDPLEAALHRQEYDGAENHKALRGRLAEFGEILEGQGFHRSQVLAGVADGSVGSLLLSRWYLDRLIRVKLAGLEDTDTNGDRTTPKRSGA